MHFEHVVRPEAGDDSERKGLEAVADYLIERGLGADDPEAARMFRRLLTIPLGQVRKISVACAARTFYLSRRSLGRWCQRSGLPAPSHVLTFGRVARTIRVARTHDMTLAAASPRTGWPDAFTLSNATYRLTGVRPSAARARGLIYLAEAWLQRELGSGKAELRRPRPPRCPACGQEVVVSDGEAKPDALCIS